MKALASPLLETTFRVGSRFFVTCSISATDIQRGAELDLGFEWRPRTPKRLWPNEWSDYRRGRDAFIAELARIAGGTALVAETGTGRMQVIKPGAQPS